MKKPIIVFTLNCPDSPKRELLRKKIRILTGRTGLNVYDALIKVIDYYVKNHKTNKEFFD